MVRQNKQTGKEIHISSNNHREMTAYCDILAAWVQGPPIRTENIALNDQTLMSFAARTKTLGLLSRGLKARGLEIRTELASHLSLQLPKMEANNYKNLTDTIAVCKYLKRKQVAHVVFKGPIQSSRVYGVWNARAALDIDILVKPEQYLAAKQTLTNNEYDLLIDDSSKWWEKHLGEAPFQRLSPRSKVIDLHHQVQQPGGPYPRNLKSYFENSVERSFGCDSVQTMSPSNALMISAISYGKSLRAGTAWLHHAHEIIVTHAEADKQERIEFFENARKDGLLNLYKEALENSQIVFGLMEEKHQRYRRAELVRLAFGQETHHRFFRTGKLWDWTDGGLIKKMPEFLSGLRRVGRSEVARLREK